MVDKTKGTLIQQPQMWQLQAQTDGSTTVQMRDGVPVAPPPPQAPARPVNVQERVRDEFVMAPESLEPKLAPALRRAGSPQQAAAQAYLKLQEESAGPVEVSFYKSGQGFEILLSAPVQSGSQRDVWIVVPTLGLLRDAKNSILEAHEKSVSDVYVLGLSDHLERQLSNLEAAEKMTPGGWNTGR